jgi:hypothetical protein
MPDKLELKRRRNRPSAAPVETSNPICDISFEPALNPAANPNC